MKSSIRIGSLYRFVYPNVFVTLPEYTAHAGRAVMVLRALDETEADPPSPDDGIEPMFKVRAADGWEGSAYESELLPLTDADERGGP